MQEWSYDEIQAEEFVLEPGCAGRSVWQPQRFAGRRKEFIAPNQVPNQVAQSARNTEGADGVGVSYDQTAPPGVLRRPVDGGDLWSMVNPSGNTLFSSLPSNWGSARLTCLFQPLQKYQQAALLLYWDDDHYIRASQAFKGNERVVMVREISANQTLVDTAAVTAAVLQTSTATSNGLVVYNGAGLAASAAFFTVYAP